jgi:hypothetical protein
MTKLLNQSKAVTVTEVMVMCGLRGFVTENATQYSF